MGFTSTLLYEYVNNFRTLVCLATRNHCGHSNLNPRLKAIARRIVPSATRAWIRRLLSRAEELRTMLRSPASRVARRVLRLPSALWARVRLAVGLQPLSYFWGHDRGLAIHRYYLEEFLRDCARDIRGHCLEFQDPSYTPRFGSSAVAKLDILHVDDSNPLATIVADLTKPNGIPSDLFDCIVCTHVLHIIFEVEKAVAEMYRILKPGGVLLVVVPHVSMWSPKDNEFWRFTPEGLRVLLARAFGEANVMVRAYGNSLVTAGEIRGLVSQEFTKRELDRNHDPRFALELCGRAVKRC